MDQAAYFEQLRRQRKNEILNTARRMILAQGIGSFNIQQLAREMDISTVTLYKYFKNSEDIMSALQKQILDTYTVPAPELTSVSDPLETFLTFHRAFYRYIFAHREDVTLLTLFEAYLRNEPDDTHNNSLITLYPPQTTHVLSDLLAAAQKNGELPVSPQPAEALSFFSLLNVSLVRQIGLMSDSDFERSRSLLTQQIEQLLHGMILYLKRDF